MHKNNYLFQDAAYTLLPDCNLLHSISITSGVIAHFQKFSISKIERMWFFIIFFILSTPLFAYTDGEYVTFDNINYRVISSTNYTLCVMGCSDAAVDATGLLEIPATISDGKDATFTVTQIDGEENATYSNKITSVKLPETMTYIGLRALNGGAVSELRIPKSVTTFYGFRNLATFPVTTVEEGSKSFSTDNDGALYSFDKKTLWMVPSTVNGEYHVRDGVEQTGAYLLKSAAITKLVWPASIKTIGMTDTKFDWDCNKLTAYEVDASNTAFMTIDGMLCSRPTSTDPYVRLLSAPWGKPFTGTYKIPDEITALHFNCFWVGTFNLDRLDLNNVVSADQAPIRFGYVKDFHLGANFNSFGYGTLFVTQVEQFTVDDNNPYFSTENGVLFNKDKTTLVCYNKANLATSYVIPNTVSTIAGAAFALSSHLTSIFIPYTVKTIEGEAFRDNSLLSLIFEDTDEHPAQVTCIPYLSLWDMSELTTLTLPRSLETIEAISILNCPKLKQIIVPNGSHLTTLQTGCFGDGGVLALNLESFTFEGSSILTTIGSGVFQNMTNLNNFIIPSTVTNIGANAFQGCSGLTNLSFQSDSQIETIGQGAFSSCGITTIDIPSSVKIIEKEAFRNCTALKSVNLSKNTTNVSPEAFKYCSNLTDFTVDADNSTYSAVLGMLCDKTKTTLQIFPPGQAKKDLVLLPPSLTAIGDYAFYDCPNLTSVVIPQKVEKIGKRAFGLDSKLTQMTFLCEKMIDPANISQATNEQSFDDGSQAADMFKNIDIYVRKNLAADYQNSSFYKKFKSIKTSFNVSHTGNETTDAVDEFIPLSKTALALLSTKANVNTFVLSSVTSPDDNVTRNVNMIGDYAFEGSDVKEVVCRNNIDAIGAMAFVTKTEKTTTGTTTTVKPVSSSIENIFFCSKTPATQLSSQVFDLTSDFSEFYGAQKVYVPKSALAAYQKAWPTFASRLDYKIPDMKVKTKYGTFAREFDVDLNDYYSTNSKGRVAAFISGGSIIPGSADYGDASYIIHMHSLDLSGHAEGSYIPANTGVLLKEIDAESTPDDFYYCIGEEDKQHEDQEEGLMHGVTVRPQTITGDNIYVMQKGSFRYVEQKTVNMPVHKAYLQVTDVPAGAKIAFTFDDNSTVDGIVGTDGEISIQNDDAPVYNLSGQRVSNPKKGIYIQEGKKIVIR